ncbi:MAG: ParB/RepB/Spo0J family partition protein [Methylocystis sp.]|uniref:ParB/RepB/Spo0J family partition protein n=1 Tax=Methylocystis sp. TaxID=1911079 RepID=UPI003DA393CB
MVKLNNVKRVVARTDTSEYEAKPASNSAANTYTTPNAPADKTDTNEVITVEIATITQSPEYQVRQKTDQATVNRYAETIKAGVVMPPVRLARVKVDNANGRSPSKPMLVLIDGFHRLAAYQKLGLVEIQATVEDLEPELARWKAAEANMSHGLQATKIELKEAFRRFVEAKQNVLGKDRQGKTRYMSYRDMGTKLAINYGTLRNWMKTEFPKIYSAMGDKVEDVDWSAKAKPVANAGVDEVSEGKDEADPVAMLEAAFKAYQATTDTQVRGQAVYLVKQIAEQMEKAGGWVDMTPEF